jgi:hypothetical protein
MPADGPHSRLFYTGFMEYFKVSRKYLQDKDGRVMMDTYYSYYDNFEDDNQNQYSAHIQIGGVTQVFRYSKDDERKDVLEEMITKTTDGFSETKRFSYNDQRAKVRDRPSCALASLSMKMQYTFDDIKGNLTSSTTRMGLTTDVEYDPVFSIPLKQTQSYLWEGEKVERISRSEINSLGQVVAQYLTMDRGAGKQEYLMQTMSYDDYGNVVMTTDPYGHQAHVLYDTATQSLPVHSYTAVKLDAYDDWQP